MTMQYDVFISYAHTDNIAREGEDGWIDSFHAALYEYLSGKLGRRANIWRDETNLRGNVLLDQTLVNIIQNSQVFIPILSPGFLRSEYCDEELNTFCRQANVIQGTKTRIFPVVKEKIQAPPPQISGNLRKFEFIVVDGFGNLTQELKPSLGEDFREKFNQKVNDLAGDVCEFIDDIKIEPAKDVPIVYLAEPSRDLFDKYLEIKRDLEERKKQGLKFEFLPQFLPQDLAQVLRKPDEADDYIRNVRKDIEQSRVTIHLIGREHNGFPAGSSQPYLHLETELAAERDGQKNFNRLVWIPKNVYTEDEMKEKDNERHKSFIAKIRQEGVGGDGLMQDSFEEFKTRIIDVIENKPPVPKKKLNDNPKPWIYVLYDQSDLDAARSVEDAIQNEGYPIFSTRDYLEAALAGEAVNINESHTEYLIRCDAVLIYWHSSPLTWVKKNAFDLQGIKPKREKIFHAQAVFCDGNLQSKSNFRSPPPPNLMKVEGMNGLPKFFDQLEADLGA